MLEVGAEPGAMDDAAAGVKTFEQARTTPSLALPQPSHLLTVVDSEVEGYVGAACGHCSSDV